MVVAVKFSGVEVGFARKLAPTDQPVELLLTRTRCSWSKSIRIGDPDVPAWTAEAVNRWLLVLHVPRRPGLPPPSCHVPAEMGV